MDKQVLPNDHYFYDSLLTFPQLSQERVEDFNALLADYESFQQ